MNRTARQPGGAYVANRSLSPLLRVGAAHTGATTGTRRERRRAGLATRHDAASALPETIARGRPRVRWPNAQDLIGIGASCPRVTGRRRLASPTLEPARGLEPPNLPIARRFRAVSAGPGSSRLVHVSAGQDPICGCLSSHRVASCFGRFCERSVREALLLTPATRAALTIPGAAWLGVRARSGRPAARRNRPQPAVEGELHRRRPSSSARRRVSTLSPPAVPTRWRGRSATRPSLDLAKSHPLRGRPPAQTARHRGSATARTSRAARCRSRPSGTRARRCLDQAQGGTAGPKTATLDPRAGGGADPGAASPAPGSLRQQPLVRSTAPAQGGFPTVRYGSPRLVGCFFP
jgi:hypothetical protein